jgi:ABC-2 type transport system permease protein
MTHTSARARLRRLKGLVVKEAWQVIRDPSSILIAFVLPLIFLFLFGYGLNLDANRLRIGLVLEDTRPQAMSLADAFLHSRFFEPRVVHDRREVADAVVASRLRGIVVIPQDFTEKLERGERQGLVQALSDGSEPNTAAFFSNYTEAAVATWLAARSVEVGGPPPALVTAQTRFWFNPELKSRNMLVPACIAIIMTIIGTLLTALVVAREWERGTMEALMATPVRVGELLFGKVLPYFILGLCSMAVCVVVGITIFEVPLRGSVPALLALSSVFLMPALGQGILISALTRNQFLAAQIALMTGILPALLLSGFVYEINSMPVPLQWVSTVVHARWLVECLQTLFLAGDVWPLFLEDMGHMLLIGMVFFGIVLLKTRKRLD